MRIYKLMNSRTKELKIIVLKSSKKKQLKNKVEFT